MIHTFLILLTVLCSVLISPVVKAETLQTGPYRIGIDDVIDIKVFDHLDLRTIATVTPDGTINFPYLGTMYVKGMTISEIEKGITEKLDKEYIKNPVVSVSLVKSAREKIFLYGAIARRGDLPYEEGLTVEKALSVAGGPSEGGMFGKLIIRRKPKGSKDYKNMVEAELNNGFIVSEEIKNMVLQPDDILIVEPNKKIFIQGAALKVGEYDLEKDMTVGRALILAGGVNKDGLYGSIKVRRKQEGGLEYKEIVEAKLTNGTLAGEVENMVLQPDDLLIVEPNKKYYVYGEFERQGEYILQENVTILKALILSGGFTKWGSPSRVKILRYKEGQGKYEIIKADIKAAMEGDATADIVLLPGDIIIASSGIF